MKVKDLIKKLRGYDPEAKVPQSITKSPFLNEYEDMYSDEYIRPWKFRQPPKIFTGSLDNPTEKDRQAEHDTLHNDEDPREQLGKEIYSGGAFSDISARDEGYPNRKQIINLINEKLAKYDTMIKELYDEIYEIKMKD